jgi:hypothetical protein
MINKRADRWLDDAGEAFSEWMFGFRLEPVSAFYLAWLCFHGSDPEETIYWGRKFLKTLENQCELNTLVKSPSLSETDDLTPMWHFVNEITQLLAQWRSDQPPPGWLGDPSARWCERHREILMRIGAAQGMRRRYCTLGEQNWKIEELMAGAQTHGAKKTAIVWREKFSGQRSWNQAARTLAYAVFGDFLVGNPQAIGFCRRCEKPFDRGKKTTYCSAECGHAEAATVSRHDANAHDRRKGLRRATKTLSRWLQNSHRAGSDWRSEAEGAFGLISSDGRYSRLMGEYIRASQMPSHSPEREKLLGSLLSRGTESHREREIVQQELDAFLEMVTKAEAKNSEGKKRKKR